MKKIILNCFIMAFIISVGGNFVAMAATLSYTPVSPCRIVDTRNTAAGMIGAYSERNFHVFGDGPTISAQGGNSGGCPSPSGEPFAAHINLVVANPTGKGNMQAFAVGGTPGANLAVNFADIGTNFANAGTVQTAVGSGPDITVSSRVSSAHTIIDVLGYYYYTSSFAPVPRTGQTVSYAPGDDGDLQMGVPWPDPRFTDNGDGTVIDQLTGLIWLKNANCFGRKQWSEALDDSNNLADGQCGLTDGSSPGDWRLPNVRELESLIDYVNYGPALPSEHPFDMHDLEDGFWWSSTSSTRLPEDLAAWVYIDGGVSLDFRPKDIWQHVWPVRGGN